MKEIILILLLTAVGITSYTQNKITTKRITIFTDGNSYVEKSGRINVIENKYVLEEEELPVARFGTLNVSASDGSLKYLTSNLNITEENKQQDNIISILSDNVGTQVELITDKEVYSGKIIKVIPGYLLLDSGKKSIIKFDNIQAFKFNSDVIFKQNAKSSTTTKKTYDNHGREIKDYNRNARVILNFDNSGTKEILLSYLQKGISWNPNYRLTLIDKKIATLSLQAEIINDVENLDNADIELVVGKPNFQFHEYLTDLIDFNNELDPFYEKQNDRNNYYNNGLLYDVVISAQNQNQTRFHDFQIHQLEHIDLSKNSRAIFNVYDYKIPYKHVYE